ncbi:protoporphyrinogen oxidase [Paenibacillus senegalensis]|uniref:protoporphyrinogen oxidase n=1 Tax=Paenibacillus senegalensis TaxID=1465766 RepID=UPI00028A0080|nr:protoporphyrinogen oxidase [Paenibacillus senegalensis]
MGERCRVVIIGGGISGLSAAYYTWRFLKEAGVQADMTVVERDQQWGGKVQTVRQEGFVMEKGPDSFLARKTPVIDLTRELGLQEDLVATNPQAKKTYILHNGRLHPMPPGLALGIPTQWKPFLNSGLISPLGKVRAAMDLVLPRRRDDGDEALGDFLERRLGKEVLENVCEPLLAGIYAGDTHQLSLQSTFPQFQAMERKSRSLILGMTRSRQQAPPTAGVPESVSRSMFLSYRHGLSSLIEALTGYLQEQGVRLLSGQMVTSLEKQPQGGASLRLDSGQELSADCVIAAVPTFVLPSLLPNLPAVARLAEMPYVSVANFVAAYDRKSIGQELDASGFLVPRKEGRFITACTWTSAKWKHTAPDDKVLVRCYIGRSGEEHWRQLPDETLSANARRELKELLGIEAKPLFSRINRWEQSMPQYPVGHLHTIKKARQEAAEYMPGLWLTGSGFHGVGIPDCIRQGKEAAQELAAYWRNRHVPQ